MPNQDDLFGPFRRRVCVLLILAGFIFVPLTVVNNPTGVGVLGGLPGMGAVGFAIASLSATDKRDSVERLWVALGLLTFAIVAVVVVRWIWL